MSACLLAFFSVSIFANDRGGDKHEVSTRVTQVIHSEGWVGCYKIRSTLYTSPVDGKSWADVFADTLKVELVSQGYRVGLYSIQASQSVCSFSFDMNENNGSLVRMTEFGPVFIKSVRDHLALSSRGMDPTAIGFGSVWHSCRCRRIKISVIQQTRYSIDMLRRRIAMSFCFYKVFKHDFFLKTAMGYVYNYANRQFNLKLWHELAWTVPLTLILSCCELRANETVPVNKGIGEKQALSFVVITDVNHSTPTIRFSYLISSIERFSRENLYRIVGPDTGESLSVAERVIVGFQQDPPRYLKTESGIQIFWGKQEGQAEIKSIAIFDSDNEIKLIGAASNIPTLYSWSSKYGVTSMSEYRRRLEQRAAYMKGPEIMLFVRDQHDADSYYPFAARWTQAALMGFNSTCSSPAQAPTCLLAEKIEIPTTIRTASCNAQQALGLTCRLIVPELKQIKIPLDMFKQ